MNIGIIGDSDSISSFEAFKIKTFEVNDAKEAIQILKNLQKNDFGIIFIIDKLAKEMETELNLFRQQTLPNIVIIPSASCNLGIGTSDLRETVKKAAGIDLF